LLLLLAGPDPFAELEENLSNYHDSRRASDPSFRDDHQDTMSEPKALRILVRSLATSSAFTFAIIPVVFAILIGKHTSSKEMCDFNTWINYNI
jgi:hypothetical protein